MGQISGGPADSSGGPADFSGGPADFPGGPADSSGGPADSSGGPADFPSGPAALNSLENSTQTRPPYPRTSYPGNNEKRVGRATRVGTFRFYQYYTPPET